MNIRPRPHPSAPDEVPPGGPRRAVPHAEDTDWVADHPPPRATPSTVAWWGLTQSLALKVITIVCALGIAAFVAWKSVPAPSPVKIPEGFFTPTPDAPRETTRASTETAPPATAFVHVAGAVHTPGLIELPEGARVADAVERAGGPVDGADLDAINLAAPLTDGEQIYLPTIDEDYSPATREGSGSPGVVNINTADEAELQQLSGIGPVMAERIVAYRRDHGPFSLVDDLQSVPGIGPVLMSQLRPGITV